MPPAMWDSEGGVSPLVGPTVELALPPGTAAGARLPWWGKMLAKLLLAHALPRYEWRRRLGIGVHSYAAGTSGNRREIERAVSWFAERAGGGPDCMLELGPGDSLANALYAAAAGVRNIWLVDVGDFASYDMAHYRAIAAAIGPEFAARVDLSSRAAMLASIGAVYLIGGLGSLSTIPTACVDLTVSYTVLEHVRRADFAGHMVQLHRVTSPGGFGLHIVDLMDHLGGGLNNLRFGARFWEHAAVAGAGFYTNRLGRRDIVALAEAGGFATAIPYLFRWPAPPVARRWLHRQFAGRSDEELTEAMFVLALHRRLGGGIAGAR